MIRLPHDHTEAVSRFWQTIDAGGLVVYPTDTLYGFGVDAFNANAIDRLTRVKGRGGPFAVMAGSLDEIREYALVSPSANEKLAPMLPGPFAIVLDVQTPNLFPVDVRAETGSVSFRIPGHPFCQAAYTQKKGLVVSTSVNRTGAPPLRDPDAIETEFGSEITLLIDGGPLPASMGSTVVNATSSPWRILRQGDGELHP